MRQQEIRTGTRVRVLEGHRRPLLSGMTGTIERIYRYRTSERMAVHVRLEDGRWQLLWPQDLELLGEDLQTGGADGS